MNRILCYMIVIFLFGCEPQPIVSSQEVAVKFDYTTLYIPAKYLLPPLPSSFIPSKGMDKDSGGASLRIPLQDISYNVGTGIGFQYVLHISLDQLSAVYPPDRLPPSGLQAWNGSGSYKNRIIEFDEVSKLYRVYGTEYRRGWEFFKSFPSSEKSPVEEWVAGCDIKFSEKNLYNFSSITCKTMFIYKDIYVQMSFSGEYLHLMEEFKIKIENLFKSWER